MRDILPQLRAWIEQGEPLALATVVQTWGSAPRRPGARMAITASGRIAGSVSGGCVEAAVVQAALEALETGRARLLDFHVTDDNAWQVGLACGGSLQVLVKPLDPQFALAVIAALDASFPLADLMVVQGPDALIGAQALFSPERKIAGELEVSPDEAANALAARKPGRFELRARGQTLGVFIDVILPAPTIVMVGGVHTAVALSSLARTLGYRTVIVDPRGVFGSPDRFPQVDLLLQSWPQDAFSRFELTPETAVCVLTHDPKIDDEALKIALNSPAFYVGALGSRKTQDSRRDRLRQAGVTEDQLMRLHGPIGLDIGAGTPEEIALSIMAEIVAARHNERQAAPAGEDFR